MTVEDCHGRSSLLLRVSQFFWDYFKYAKRCQNFPRAWGSKNFLFLSSTLSAYFWVVALCYSELSTTKCSLSMLLELFASTARNFETTEKVVHQLRYPICSSFFVDSTVLISDGFTFTHNETIILCCLRESLKNCRLSFRGSWTDENTCFHQFSFRSYSGVFRKQSDTTTGHL